MSDVIVRGRDFTAYRIGGAIAAALLFAALLWQTYEIFDGDAMTVPETSWTAVNDGEGSGENAVLADDILVARTRLLDERFKTGPSPEEPGFAAQAGQTLVEEPIDGYSKALPEAWMTGDAEMLRMLRPGQRTEGLSSLPYVNAALFERPEGRDWRLGMADFITHLGALVILGFAFLLALLLAIRGRVPIAEGRARTKVKRFGFLERATHWMTATSFIGLALTGIVIAYGETLILPFGGDLLGQAGWIATWGHAVCFPPFAFGILIMGIMWVGRNIPDRLDWIWLKNGGGLFSDEGPNPPAKKFNAGQKLIFWSAMLGGILMVGTGVMLMFPFFFLGLEAQAWVMLGHATVATFLIAIFIGHIYIGTVGMQGAIDAMWSGRVDRNWAKEHHELWLKDIEKEETAR
ncbi:formate dehydrogenase subunit gamma [Poseidonocella pacifica]|uniref:Formate dehydrogenase subunit gamma n=1 Tax=Poseidonocella pacifica TaxID=871651 RepID=A0A1I0YFD3_9RHOB|nr:formate dehydrogenase subunit gamma [Poseidonocella pacifica]SFB11078.1 formate dehydrogenase subunit gamma [Poseidonocella pacifica]